MIRKEYRENPEKCKTKLDTVYKCLRSLDDFCNNKIINTQPDQKYGQVNSQRQKILKEQYYLELLTEMLKKGLGSSREFEQWNNL